MQTIDDPGEAFAVLHDPGFVVPPVPAATHGVAWLRANVGRFSSGEAHTRRRALSESLLSTVDPAALRAAAASSPHAHPVQLLATALHLDSSPRTIAAVGAVAAAYQPGTGDETAADAAVRTLIDTFGGAADEPTAARIGVLVQACAATVTLIADARATDLETPLRDTPPVPATKRMATRPADLGGTRVDEGEVVRVSLHGIPFGAGPRACPGRAHALALVEGALAATAGSREAAPDGGRPSGDMPDRGRPSGDMLDRGRPSGDMPDRGRPSGHMPDRDRPSGDMPDRDRPSNGGLRAGVLGGHGVVDGGDGR